MMYKLIDTDVKVINLSKPLDNRNLFKLFGVFKPDSFESRRLCILLLSQNVLIYHDDFKSMMIL